MSAYKPRSGRHTGLPRRAPVRPMPSRTEWASRLEVQTERDPNSGCWLWSGNSVAGYGRLTLRGVGLLAHRAAFFAAGGDLQLEMDVLHSCDTPACINPAHLRLGTHQDNMADRKSRGRSSGGDLKGEQCPWAKVSAEQVAAIRGESRPGRLAAPEYGISKAQFYRIKRRERWSHG